MKYNWQYQAVQSVLTDQLVQGILVLIGNHPLAE